MTIDSIKKARMSARTARMFQSSVPSVARKYYLMAAEEITQACNYTTDELMKKILVKEAEGYIEDAKALECLKAELKAPDTVEEKSVVEQIAEAPAEQKALPAKIEAPVLTGEIDCIARKIALPSGGIIDMLGKMKGRCDYVLIQLKNGAAGKKDIEQLLNYMNEVNNADGIPVDGKSIKIQEPKAVIMAPGIERDAIEYASANNIVYLRIDRSLAEIL